MCMVSDSRYGLVHPNSEAVYAANYLWYLFSAESEFRTMLNQSYAKAADLLDVVANRLSPIPSPCHLGYTTLQSS